MSTDQFRALCAELLDELIARPLCLDRALIDRARAALAEPFRPIPMPEGARTLQVLLAVGAECAGGAHLSTEQCRLATDLLAQAFPGSTAQVPLSEPADGPAAVAGQPSPTQTPAKGPPRQELRQLFRDQTGYIDDEQVMLIDDFCAAASVVLARWGNLKAGLTSSPAEGEVAELVAWLHAQYGGLGRRAILNRIAELLQRQAAPVPVPAPAEIGYLLFELRAQADLQRAQGYGKGADALTRAAELLGRQAAPVPVPVGERLPKQQDCDAMGFCWWYDYCEAAWTQCDAQYARHVGFRHWLPAHALPLPARGGEVQPDA